MLYLHFSLKVHRSEELYHLRIENESIPFKFSPRYNKTIRHLDTLGIQVIIIILQTYIIEVKYLRYTSNPNYYDIREWQPFKNLLYSGYGRVLFAFQGKMAQPKLRWNPFSLFYTIILRPIRHLVKFGFMNKTGPNLTITLKIMLGLRTRNWGYYKKNALISRM